MTLNGRNAPLAKINKNFGAHHKNFNENRLILSAAKCGPVSVVSKNIRYMRICIAYYRAMLRKAWLWDCMSSVRLCDFHTGWNTSKIIARPNSLGSLLSLTPTGAVWCNENTPKMGGRIRVGSDEAHKSRKFPCFLTYDITKQLYPSENPQIDIEGRPPPL